MELADLVDLETLNRDGGPRSPASVERARVAVLDALSTAGIAPEDARARAQTDPALRHRLLIAIVRAERAAGELSLPGTAVQTGFGIVGAVLVLLGLLVGAGATGAMLAYDGTTPVLVLPFVAVLCFGQIAMLVATLWFVARALRTSGSEPSWLHRAIGSLARRFSGERGRAAAEAFHRARTRHALLADVETWTLFGLVQRFAVSFNVGVLALAFFRIATTDIVFGWATTMELDGDTVHRVVRALAAPWSWWLPAAVPDAQMVAATEWSRMQSAFVPVAGVDDAERLARGWWPFLVAGVVAYGLAPRIAALLFGAWRSRRARRGLRFDDAASERLLDRALPAATGWRGPDAGAMRGPAPGGVVTRRDPEPSAVGAVSALLAWGNLGPSRDALAELLERRFGAAVRARFGVGGADLAADDAAIVELTHSGIERAWLVCTAGQQPTKEVLGFVRDLRVALGGGRPILVLLVDGSADSAWRDAETAEIAAWERSLAALEDPHCWVGRLEVDA